MTGQTVIKRVKTDSTEIRFVLKDNTETIATFWQEAINKTYTYLYKV